MNLERIIAATKPDSRRLVRPTQRPRGHSRGPLAAATLSCTPLALTLFGLVVPAPAYVQAAVDINYSIAADRAEHNERPMTIMLNEHERLLIENFVKKDKQGRLRYLMSEPNRRSRLRAKFSSTFVFLEEKQKSIPGSDQTPTGIYQLLRQMGASEHCYMISEHDDLDGQGANLREMLDRLVGAGIETIVSCVPGKLVYFEGERERFILRHSVK